MPLDKLLDKKKLNYNFYKPVLKHHYPVFKYILKLIFNKPQ
jgi:hypothetical protein